MTTKQSILYHIDGVKACEKEDWITAISIFHQIENPYAGIYFNLGCCYLHVNEYVQAEDAFKKCITRDRYLAVGHFQLGIAQAYLDKLEIALTSFNQSFTCLRANAFIDYTQLSMNCKLYASEVKMNIALIYLFLGDEINSRALMLEAASLPKEEDQHHFVTSALDALNRQNWAYFGDSIISKIIKLPKESIFYPNKSKLEGIQSDISKFSKAATVVSATSEIYSFTGFVGAKKLQNFNESSYSGKESKVMPPPPTSIPPRNPRRLQANILPSRVPSKPSFAPPLHPSMPSNPPPPLPSNKIYNYSPQQETSSTRKATNEVSLEFNLTVGLSLKKKDLQSYDGFVSTLSKNLLELGEELPTKNTGGFNLMTKSPDLMYSKEKITSQTWFAISANALNENKMDVFVNLDSNTLNITPEKEKERGPKPRQPASPFSSMVPSFAKINLKNTNTVPEVKTILGDDSIYTDGVVDKSYNYQDKDDEIYTSENVGSLKCQVFEGGNDIYTDGSGGYQPNASSDDIYSDIP